MSNNRNVKELLAMLIAQPSVRYDYFLLSKEDFRQEYEEMFDLTDKEFAEVEKVIADADQAVHSGHCIIAIGKFAGGTMEILHSPEDELDELFVNQEMNVIDRCEKRPERGSRTLIQGRVSGVITECPHDETSNAPEQNSTLILQVAMQNKCI